MMILADLRRNYRAAFLGYLPRRDETPLHAGYETGRAAVSAGMSILDIVQVHHEVLVEVLRSSRGDELDDIAMAASEFLVEVLATYDMTQRALRPPA